MAERTTKSVIARVPYLNCAPFFDGMAPDESWELADLTPRQLGTEAGEGKITSGPIPLVDFLRLQEGFERIGNLGVAVRGRSGSALLFSRKPIRQLDEAIVAVTEETSTTALLLRLILEKRYGLSPKDYQRGELGDESDAMLLIGDAAIQFRSTNRRYPYEIDLSFEWWLWQHLPFVFAVWAVRKDCHPQDKQRLSHILQKSLAMNLARLDALAEARAGPLHLSADELKQYLANFIYRLSESEERAIKQFERLIHEHGLL